MDTSKHLILPRFQIRPSPPAEVQCITGQHRLTVSVIRDAAKAMFGPVALRLSGDAVNLLRL
jgi:hypothetical protein